MLRSIVHYTPTVVLNRITAVYFKVNALKHVGFRGSHSIEATVNLDKMKVHIIPALSDNYMYLIVDKQTNQAAVVDPVNPDRVLELVKNEGVNLTKVLITHHHWDHAGGNEELVKKSKNALQIFGGDKRVGCITNQVNHGDKFTIGNINVECLHTPCHTSGHICYFLTAEGESPAVFTGDTLFIAGCGKFFEGTAEQMYSSLIEKLANLPSETKVYCGHEYTVQNLKFASHVEGDNNTNIKEKLEWAREKRAKDEPTVPSTIGEEKLYNPFMRVQSQSVQKHALSEDPIQTMANIRKEKDSFKG